MRVCMCVHVCVCGGRGVQMRIGQFEDPVMYPVRKRENGAI